MSEATTTPIRARARPAATSGKANPRRRELDLGAGEGVIEVSRALYHRGSLIREDPLTVERVRVQSFEGPVACIRVEGSVTRNLGDYNSARVAVAVQLPCYPEDSEIRRAYNYASDLLDELVPTELARAVSGG